MDDADKVRRRKIIADSIRENNKTKIVNGITIKLNISDVQIAAFLELAESRGLDPLARQIHASVDKNSRIIPIVGVDGLRIIAERSGKYAGQRGPFYYEQGDGGKPGRWVDVWTKATPPFAARYEILHKDFEHPIVATALWSEYGQNTDIWKKFRTQMLAKCAESLGFRRAFPELMSGFYVEEEFPSKTAIEKKARGKKEEVEAVDVIGNFKAWIEEKGVQNITRDMLDGMADGMTDNEKAEARKAFNAAKAAFKGKQDVE